MLLKHAHDWLGWPQPDHVFKPQGAGQRVCLEFAERKIQATLKRQFPKLGVQTGLLVPNSQSTDTVAPLAVVCQFEDGANQEQLDEVHRLAWNFSRTALLVTLEPTRLIAWSCFRDPTEGDERIVCELPTPEGFAPTGTAVQRSVRDLLHWVSLITGDFQRKTPEKFPANGRADALLLKNLKYIRRRLITEMHLKPSFCHDLLARIIFTQYLFHRQDSEGNAYFSESLLKRRCDGALQQVHSDFPSILQDKDETYALFRWLDKRFNGDLFPGKDEESEQDRDASWQAEKDAVSPEHLRALAELVSGSIDSRDRQLLLWPEYRFDTIPLEFISSVYEEFLNEDRDKNKAYYTPSHLVDYVLDAVLPWDGKDWDLRILDPCCGSGIFLVKAFQRLIHRWCRANGRSPLVSDLKPILANNFTGIDINEDAIRVASFSLYLTMADAIEPKHYVTRERVFPKLRGVRLIAKDFFDEATPGFRTKEDAETFDLVVGNAPWGDKSITKTSDSITIEVVGKRKKRKEEVTKAKLWANINQWKVANRDIGPLFLLKSMALVKKSCQVAMLQPAPTWLGHRAEPAVELRKTFFSSFKTEEITNLTAIRREIFNGAIGAACLIVVSNEVPAPESEIWYFAPKPLIKDKKLKKGNKRVPSSFCLDPYDISRVSHQMAANDSLALTVFTLGGPRDFQLIRRVCKLDNLHKLESKNAVITRQGVIPGDRKQNLIEQFPEIGKAPYFEAQNFPSTVFLYLDATQIPQWGVPLIDGSGSTDFRAFKMPQLLIKQSYSTNERRFRAAIVLSSSDSWGTICKKTYLSVHDNSQSAENIRWACAVYNSRFAAYFLALTSVRILFNQEVLSEELISVPLPPHAVNLEQINSFADVDRLIEAEFSLTPAERVLIDDLLDIRLPDILRTTPGLGRNPTIRGRTSSTPDPELSVFVQTIFRVLENTFGSDKQIAATIYQEPDGQHLPVRMLTLHFDWPGREAVTIEPIEADGLLDKIAAFHRDLLSQKGRSSGASGAGFQRVAFLFHSHTTEDGPVRSLSIIKPDERRFWTRSIAMRDADDLAAAIFKAAGWKGERP